MRAEVPCSDIAGHLAAQRDATPGARGGRDDLRKQFQDRRMQRIVEVGQVIVVAVDGQRVLDQIVGADRRGNRAADHAAQRDRRGRHFDHRAERDVRRRLRGRPCADRARIRATARALRHFLASRPSAPARAPGRTPTRAGSRAAGSRSSCGWRSDRRTPRTPSAGLCSSSSTRPVESALSAPRSSVRIVTGGRPCRARDRGRRGTALLRPAVPCAAGTGIRCGRDRRRRRRTRAPARRRPEVPRSRRG